MPDAFMMKSVEDSASGASGCDALWRRTYSLKDATSSSLEMDWPGVNSPVPLKAIPVTDGTLLELRREAGPRAAQIQAYWRKLALPLWKRLHGAARNGFGAFFRRTGFHNLPGMGARAFLAGGDGGLRLRPAPRGGNASTAAHPCAPARTLFRMGRTARG